MDGFRMVSCRTCGMAPSDIKTALLDGTLQICHREKMRPDQLDEILDGFLHRGIGPRAADPRCVSILAIGRSYSGMPVARIEITTPTSSHLATPAVCTYCPQADTSCTVHGLDLYDAWQDDPLWNRDILEDDGEDE